MIDEHITLLKILSLDSKEPKNYDYLSEEAVHNLNSMKAEDLAEYLIKMIKVAILEYRRQGHDDDYIMHMLIRNAELNLHIRLDPEKTKVMENILTLCLKDLPKA